MSEKKKFTIGEIAKICGITPRQLRYYDTAGIIKPSYRNPESGYRYYTEDQIELLIFLTDLKNIGISNESAQRLFVNRNMDQLVQELQINLAMVEQEINAALNRYKSIVNALVMNTRALSYLQGDEAISSDYKQFWISVVQFPRTKIIYKKYNVNWCNDISIDYLKHAVDLKQIATEERVSTIGNKMTIFHHGTLAQFGEAGCPRSGAIEIIREIEPGTPVSNPERIRYFGEFSAIFTIYVGDPSVKRHAYDILFKWAADHNLTVSDTAIEEYMVDSFTSTSRRHFVTKIYLPLEGSIV